jgi:hypothetical protein
VLVLRDNSRLRFSVEKPSIVGRSLSMLVMEIPVWSIMQLGREVRFRLEADADIKGGRLEQRSGYASSLLADET